MNTYRAEHLRKNSPEPNYERALEFFQLSSRIREKDAYDLAVFYSKQPLLAMYYDLEAQLAKTDQFNLRRHKHCRYLLAYLSDLLSWQQAGEMTEQESAAQNVVKTTNTSTRDIGILVDSQIQQLAQGRELVRAPHIYTRWFIQYLYQRRWMICGAQVPLWNNDGMHPIKTTADVICYDVLNKRFVLIELKTGYDHDYDKPFHPQQSHELRPDSHSTRHQYQLAWMHHRLAKELQTASGALYSIVLRINDTDGVTAPREVDALILNYFADQHEKQMHARYLIDSGNSIDPYASQK